MFACVVNFNLSAGRARRAFYSVALAVLFCAGLVSFAAQLPPAPSQYIVDKAGVLRQQDIADIDKMLSDIERQTSCQVVVAIYESLPSGEALEDYANRLFRAWGIGKKEKNNGVLLLIFIKDRKLRIEVGYGLEGVIPDAIAKRIIDEKIAPFFRSGNYSGGIKSGISAINSAIKGEYKPVANSRAPALPIAAIPFLAFMIFWLTTVIVISRMRYQYTGAGRTRRWGPFTITTGGYGSGGGWSGGGGGGFSGGGGSSGGGGASGSW
ncbi:MAG: TPM domain-containing protein [Verrucomicrobiia bacterium]